VTTKYSNEQPEIDYAFWLRTAYWTSEEGAALALGIDPKLIDNQTLNGLCLESDLHRKYKQLCELATRAKKIGRLEELANPIAFLEWVQAIDFTKIPEDIQVARTHSIFHSYSITVSDDGAEPFSSIIDYKKSYEGLEKTYYKLLKEVEERERDQWEEQEFEDKKISLYKNGSKSRVFDERQRKTMLKILLSLAVNKFRFNPNNKRSSASKNIASTTELCGLSVTDETIRDHLKSAVAEYPQIRNLFEEAEISE
jgi:hypothetical protein|tara:strand:- start:773 stop:1534 length:762 start_codon:yes stop_codon:yes gene_type:complete